MIRQLAATPADAVCECASGNEALRLAPEFQPDCVTMDVRMPGMCSFEATRAIRAAVPSVKVIVVTSYDEPFLRHIAGEAGVVDYFVKENLAGLRAALMGTFASGNEPPNRRTIPEPDGLPTGGEEVLQIRQQPGVRP